MRQITFNECNLYVLSLCVFAWARMPCHGDDDWWGSSARARSRCGLTPVQVVRDNNGVMHRDCLFVWRHLRCDKMPLFAVCLCMPCICHSRLSFAAASVCYSFLCVHSLDLHNNKSDKLVDRSSGSNSSVSRKQNRRKQIREQQQKKNPTAKEWLCTIHLLIDHTAQTNNNRTSSTNANFLHAATRGANFDNHNDLHKIEWNHRIWNDYCYV